MSMLKKIVILSLVMFSTQSFSEESVYIKEYVYQASDDDSKSSSRKKSIKYLQKKTLSEIISYVSGATSIDMKTVSKNDKDDYVNTFSNKVETLTAGYIKTKVLDEKWDGVKFWIKVEFRIDEDEAKKEVQKLLKSRNAKVDSGVIPAWYRNPPKIKNKRVRVVSGDSSLAVLVSSIYEIYYTNFDKKKIDNIISDASKKTSFGASKGFPGDDKVVGVAYSFSTNNPSSYEFEAKLVISISKYSPSWDRLFSIAQTRVLRPSIDDEWQVNTVVDGIKEAEVYLRSLLKRHKFDYEVVGVPKVNPQRWYAKIVGDPKILVH